MATINVVLLSEGAGTTGSGGTTRAHTVDERLAVYQVGV